MGRTKEFRILRLAGFIATMMLALAMLLPVSAQEGLGGDPDAPIEIQADNLEVYRDRQLAVFIGNVDAQQGRMNLKTDELHVSYREGGDGGEGAAVGPTPSRVWRPGAKSGYRPRRKAPPAIMASMTLTVPPSFWRAVYACSRTAMCLSASDWS